MVLKWLATANSFTQIIGMVTLKLFSWLLDELGKNEWFILGVILSIRPCSNN
jgi:hypothetical protein